MAAAQTLTPRQSKILAAVEEHGQRGAARVLGVSAGTVGNTISRIRQALPVPDGHNVKGVSALYDAKGALRLQWVKSAAKTEAASRLALEEWIDGLAKRRKIAAPVIRKPKFSDKDLCAVYPMGDPHFGMYAWAQEAGEDFDLSIAERLTQSAIDRLVACAPAAKHALILELGDFFHSDNRSNRTEASGAMLDVDTRYQRVLEVGFRCMTYVVEAALRKHERVTVRIVQGNHDWHSSLGLALGLKAYFRANKRVVIDTSPAEHFFFRFGQVLIGVTHGHMNKPAQLPGIMATDRAKDWGETTHRVWYCGHVHHSEKNEYPGCSVEYFRSLTARDAWHAASGYRSGRDMTCIVHHRQHGEIERHRCDIGMIQ